MKALKEKRIGLRSLLRRGLVILSLFALLLAVGCSSSDDTSDNSGNGNGGNGGGGYQVPISTVTNLTVLQHPYLPSYEGAAPNLEGLVVMVTVDNSTTFTATGSDFVTYPGVATVNAPGTSIHAFSNVNEYQIKYVGGGATLSPDSTRVNVYIPTVLAIDQTKATDGANWSGTKHYYYYVDDNDYVVKMSDLGVLYEDQDFDETDADNKGKVIEITADYVSPTADGRGPQDLKSSKPVGYFSEKFDRICDTAFNPNNEWISAVDGEKTARPKGTLYSGGKNTRPASKNPDSWTVNPAGTRAQYKIATKDSSQIYYVDAKVTKFYLVDRFDYADGAQNIVPVIADAEQFAQPGEFTRIWWWWNKFYPADLKFTVTYYDSADPGSPKPTRTIGVKEYTRAMYKTDSLGNPKATPPILSGVSQADDARGVKAGVLTSIGGSSTADIYWPWISKTTGRTDANATNDEYNLVAQLYYYNRLIEPDDFDTMDGFGNIKDVKQNWGPAGSTQTVINTDDYVHPNVATIDLTQNGLVLTYSRIETVRKDNTNHGGEAISVSNWGGAGTGQEQYEEYNKRNVMGQLNDYWYVQWIYVDTAGKEYAYRLDKDLKMPNYKFLTSTSFWQYQNIVDFDNEAAEEVETTPREMAIAFSLPVSAEGNKDGDTTATGDSEELAFPYYMKQ